MVQYRAVSKYTCMMLYYLRYDAMHQHTVYTLHWLTIEVGDLINIAHPGGYYGVLRSTRVVPVIFRRQISNVARVKYKN